MHTSVILIRCSDLERVDIWGFTLTINGRPFFLATLSLHVVLLGKMANSKTMSRSP